MTTFYLIRHGSNDVLSHSIAGRLPGISLNAEGRVQAVGIAAFLKDKGINSIITSPLERTRETAAPLAEMLGIGVETRPEFNEVDFGDWTGRTIEELESLNAWKKWNTYRSGNRTPNGENMTEVQARVVGGLQRLRWENPDRAVAVFSHGDPIRAAILYYLGMPLDFIQRLRIDPGTVSILNLTDWMPQLIALNQPSPDQGL